jgi:CheY-like chemotaxis protein
MQQETLDQEDGLDILRGMPAPSPRLTVLIVDDEPSIVALLSELLEEAGYRALRARNGRMALAIAQHERPSLVITDRNMPVLDGVSLVRRLRSNPRTCDIPILMMSSAWSSAGNVDAAEQVPFVAKPFDLEDLLAAVAICIGPPDENRP